MMTFALHPRRLAVLLSLATAALITACAGAATPPATPATASASTPQPARTSVATPSPTAIPAPTTPLATPSTPRPTQPPTTTPTATATPRPTATRPAPTPTSTPAGPDSNLKIVTLLPRDAIPAILEPSFLSAAEASEQYMPTEQVLGVSINGRHKAYSVPYLSSREIVNDRLGGVAIAATW